MENPEVLEKILMYTGIAGLVVFGVFTIFRGIIQKNIFASMNDKQSYGIIKLIIRGSLTLAVIGIIAWGYIEIKKDEAYKNSALISKKIKGTIISQNGDPVQNAKVALKKNENNFHISDVNGEFLLEVTGTGNKSFDLIITHPNYQNITKLAEVNFTSTEVSFNVGKLPLRPVKQIEIPDTQPISSTKSDVQKKKNVRNDNSSKTANINLFYEDEGTGCTLQINISIGGKVYTPQSNPVELLDVRKGLQQYTITGTGYCGTGQCQLSGNGQIKIIDDGQYYMVFDPNFTCVATILSEDDYNTLLDAVY